MQPPTQAPAAMQATPESIQAPPPRLGPTDASVAEAAAPCALTDTGPVIQDDTSTSSQPLPAGAGGTIKSGTYFMMHHYYYQGSSGGTGSRQGTYVFDASAKTFNLVFSDKGGPQQHAAGTYSTNGTNLTLHVTCPGALDTTVPYSFSGGALTQVTPTDDTTTVWQKQ